MNDFGYFGSGLEGYAHYMQSFNDNFSEDNADIGEAFDNIDDFDEFENYSFDDKIDTLCAIAFNSIEAIKSEITDFINLLKKDLSNGSLCFLETDIHRIYDKQFDLMTEAIKYLKSIESHLDKPSVLATHNKEYYQHFLNLSNSNIKLLEQKVKILDKKIKSLSGAYELTDEEKTKTEQTKKKYLEKLKRLEKDFVNLKI